MRLVTSLLLLACLWGTGLAHPTAEVGGGGQGDQKLTWAEVLGVNAPPSPSELVSGGDDGEEYYYYDDDDQQGGGGGGGDEEDDPFANSFYEYVDTEDPSYTPPPPPDPDATPETANRRTLDLLYHWFLGPKHGESRDSKPRPSLIEEVFRTIDNHIIEDLREWNSNAFSHIKTKPAIAKPTLPGLGHLFQSPQAAAPAAPQQTSSSDDDALLVTDASGKEHLVTIDDIVASLGHLDERTLTEILLGTPQATARQDVVVPQAHALPQPTGLIPVLVPRQQPVVATANQEVLLTPVQGPLGDLVRPVRHTGPIRVPPQPQPVQVSQNGDDVYIVRDETGAVQVVTLQDIMASLSALDPSTANQLLFGEGAAPVLPPLPTGVLSPNTITAPNDKGATTTTTTTTTTARPTADPLPTVNTDTRGDIHVRAHPGSVTLDLQSGDWKTKAAQEEEEAPKDASPQKAEDSQVMVDGSVVRRDENGNIHITPDPSRPFTLDVGNIISMAEKAEGQSEKQRKEKVEEVVEEGAKPSRGHELLSFLGGGRDSLPTAIPPQRPLISSPVRVQGSAPASLLLQSLGRTQQQQAPSTTPAPSEGLGARLSGFLSRLVGGEPEQPAPRPAVVVAPAPEPLAAALTPEDEYVQLVLRQQNRDAPEAVFGDVLIPLPQPIHHRTPSNPPVKREAFPSGNKDATEEEAEEAAPAVSSVLGGLPQRVLDTLRSQLQDVPRFIPPALRGAQQQAEERSDTVVHNEVASLASMPLEALAARVSAPSSSVASPSVASPPSSSRPPVPYSSTSPFLSKLPPPVLRQILLQAAQRRQNTISKTPTSPTTPDKPQDRSSYAEVPSYEGVTGGYGYGGGSGDSENPLFDIFFLADATSLYKVGDTNLSLDTPKIGDPKNFVDTRHPFGYHYGLHRPNGYQQSHVYQQPYTYPEPVVTYSYY